jgi:hypothetical protein
MISVVKHRFGVAEIHDNNSASAVLIHRPSVITTNEFVVRSPRLRASFQLGGVAEIVNSSFCPLKKKESVAILLLAVREHAALQRSNVAPIGCVELQSLV